MAAPWIYGTPENYTKWHGILHHIVTTWKGVAVTHLADYYAFADFIGHPYTGGKFIVDFTKPEVADILLTLNSPHIKALLKVMKLRKANK